MQSCAARLRGGGAVLTEAEVATYAREGWLVPDVALPAAALASASAALTRLIADNPAVRPERLVSAHLEESGIEGVKGRPEFYELATHPLILDAVEQIIGPDIALWGCQVFCKPAGDGMEVPMHQDGQYWPIRPLATCSVWVALDRSDAANGCLRVVPRSHAAAQHFAHERRGEEESRALVLNQAIAAPELARLEPPRDVELEAGQFSMHDVYTVHGSNPNTSSRRRAGVALRYMPAASVLERELFASDAETAGYTVDWARRPLFLVRGADRSGGRNAYTTRQ